MPPKDDQQRSDMQQQQQSSTSSPTSPASFFLQVQPSSSSEGGRLQQPEDPAQQQEQPFLELERSPTATAPVDAVKLPSFRLLPRQPSPDPQEVPAFLAFLNKLHGGDCSTSDDGQVPSSTASQFGSSSSSSVVAAADRHVLFADDLLETHETLSRADYTSIERSNTWYTDRYLRISSQMHAMEDDEDDEDFRYKAAGHKRDLILAAARIRRAMQAVMKEQSRTPYLSPGAKRQKEDRIREAYHRVTLQCQRDAKGRGEEAAKSAARIRES